MKFVEGCLKFLVVCGILGVWVFLGRFSEVGG